MRTQRHLYCCLVHEKPAVVEDLICNLQGLDPEGIVLLYNGGNDPNLLQGLSSLLTERVLVHPAPRPLEWGRLHDFAIDSMRYALATCSFDALTIVDSDQLMLRRGYAERIAHHLGQDARIGMLGSEPGLQGPTTAVPPAQTAWREVALWRPFLKQFPEGEREFVRWTFWPATVFTADAARALVRLVDEDPLLPGLLRRTHIFATEEVILPTLVALLGYRIAQNPCSLDFVRYRTAFTPEQLESALRRQDVFWIHPVAREPSDPLRRRIREATRGVQTHALARGEHLKETILARIAAVEGWMEEDEAALLIDASVRALGELSARGTIVEVGSYLGRSTVALASVAKTFGGRVQVHAIDPHEGEVGAADQGVSVTGSTKTRFLQNLSRAGVRAHVRPIYRYSFEVDWNEPIAFLLVDGLHDYANVARDFRHFARWLMPGAYIAFHDCADYYPGVQRFVRETLVSGPYEWVQQARSLAVIRKRRHEQPTARPGWQRESRLTSDALPEVTCILPTADRRPFIPSALRWFFRQDYPRLHLIVVDDGDDPVEDLIPRDLRVSYYRVARGQSLGGKRNMACEQARGDLIVHWDDDDWSAPWRIRSQVEALLASRAEICGLGRPYFFDLERAAAWQYHHPPGSIRPWVYGATLCYTRDRWRRTPFEELMIGEDSRFVWSGPSKSVHVLRDERCFVAGLHPGRTSPLPSPGLRWQAVPPATIATIMGEDFESWQLQMAR